MLRQVFGLSWRLFALWQHRLPLVVDLGEGRAHHAIVLRRQLASAAAARAWPPVDLETLAVRLSALRHDYVGFAFLLAERHEHIVAHFVRAHARDVVGSAYVSRLVAAVLAGAQVRAWIPLKHWLSLWVECSAWRRYVALSEFVGTVL